MTVFDIHAYAFSTTFRLKEYLHIFENATPQLEKDRLVFHFSDSQDRFSLGILYKFGALVLVGLSKEEREELLKTIIKHQVAEEPHPPLTEDFLIEHRPNSAIEVKFDRIVVPELSIPVFEIISLLLAQSAAMDYYEEDVQEILQRTKSMSISLQNTGRLPGRVDDSIKFIGSCIATKNDVISTLALLDKPESTWNSPELDRLYNLLRQELELNERFRSLETKLRMIQENLVLLVDLAKQRSSFRLEFTIMFLILLELILMLWQLYRHSL